MRSRRKNASPVLRSNHRYAVLPKHFLTDQHPLQGDDAVRFKADYDTVLQQMPGSGPDQILAQLWDQGGYSWLAAAEADGG